jgi:hypothetical protein
VISATGFRWSYFLIWGLLWAAPLRAQDAAKPFFYTRNILLNDHYLELHLARPTVDTSPTVFVLYASGDGGWYGAAVDMFKDIARLGYPTVGFSCRSFMKLLSYGQFPVEVPDLSRDYLKIVEESRKALNLAPDTPVILTGWSRGAAFSVLVGSELEFKPQCAGVVAINLPDKEELNIRKHGKRILIANFHAPRQSVLFETFERIPEIGPRPCALIQSTRDDFLPAQEALPLFGTDSAQKKFFPVEARNHRFSGGWGEFRKALADSLSWIAQCQAGSPK